MHIPPKVDHRGKVRSAHTCQAKSAGLRSKEPTPPIPIHAAAMTIHPGFAGTIRPTKAATRWKRPLALLTQNRTSKSGENSHPAYNSAPAAHRGRMLECSAQACGVRLYSFEESSALSVESRKLGPRSSSRSAPPVSRSKMASATVPFSPLR